MLFVRHLLLQNFRSSKQKAHFFMLLKINAWLLLGDAEVVESAKETFCSSIYVLKLESGLVTG